MEDVRSIYVIVSRTKTCLGRIIRFLLGVDYNHCSICFDESLDEFYSFGRKSLWNSFDAGFVKESKNYGFFGIHRDCQVVVLRFDVDRFKWEDMRDEIRFFECRDNVLRYSLLGLLFCFFGIPVNRRDKYFCSQFVSEVLEYGDIRFFDKPSCLVRPDDFLNVGLFDQVYSGRIGDYCIA